MAFAVGNIAFNPAFDSPISVSFADAYHEKRGNTAWADLDDEVKEQLLVKVADYLTATYSQVWSYATRMSLVTPGAMQKAAAELAFISRSTPLVSNITRGKKKVKVGPIEVEYDGTAATQTKFVLASRMIAPLLGFTSGVMVKLTRC
jgi:hypothetical protein